MMVLRNKLVAWGLILTASLLLLSACGSDEQDDAPNLAAPPTRTPAPATATPAPDDALAAVELIPLHEDVAAFLDEAASASPLDRPVLFNDLVFNAHPECFSDAYYPNTDPLELLSFNLISVDLDFWRETLDSYPDAVLRTSIEQTLARAADAIPVQDAFRVCIIPVPGWHRPGEPPIGDFNAQALSGGVVLAWCQGGAQCAETADDKIAYAYHYAAQLARTDLTINTTTLGDFMIMNARADDFATHLLPDASFPWHVELAPALETSVWATMQEFLGVTYQDYPEYRKIEYFLYGRGTEQYPDWGGMVIGQRIIDAFHENNPLATYAELAAMPANAVIDQSGYMPGQTAYAPQD